MPKTTITNATRVSGLYDPEPINPDLSEKELIRYVEKELWKISAIFTHALTRNIEVAFVAPEKPRDGMVRLADGISWNPASGQGVYVFYNNIWNRLG